MYHVQTGDLFATNPDTGMVTIMHTSNNETEHPNQPGPLVPINSGNPHSYYPGHRMSPRRVRSPFGGVGLDSVTESTEAANFRRHFAMFKKYLGSGEEDPYTAAYRIWTIHPSDSSGMEPEEEEEPDEDEGVEKDEDTVEDKGAGEGEGAEGGDRSQGGGQEQPAVQE